MGGTAQIGQGVNRGSASSNGACVEASAHRFNARRSNQRGDTRSGRKPDRPGERRESRTGPEFANRIAPQLVIHGLVRSRTPFRCSRRFSFRITPTTLPPPAHRSQRFRSEAGRSKRSARAGETPSIRSGEPDGSRQPDVPMRFGNSPGSTSPRREITKAPTVPAGSCSPRKASD